MEACAGVDLAGMKRRELQALCKRHGLPAGGTNAALVARLDAALSAGAGAAEEVAGVLVPKGCLKQTGGDAAEAKKVTFAAEEGKARRLRSRVIWSPVVAKTRGKSAQASTESAAAAAEDSVSSEVGADVPLRRSRRNSVSAAEAEELGAAVAVDRKRKRKDQENDESVAVSAQVGVSSRVTRRSSLAGAAVVLPPAVEKKRGRGRAAGGSNKLAAETQDCESDVQNSARVEVSDRITRSRAAAPVVMSPTVVESKRRRKTGDAQTNVEQPAVSDVPTNDAPVTRSLRNKVVQVSNSMADETHTARQLENKAQPSRPPTRRNQQVSSSVEDKNQEQIAAHNKAPLLRRSGRNHSEDAEKQQLVKEPVKRSARKSVVLATLEKVENDLIEEKNPQAHVRRSTRKSIVTVKDIKGIGEQIQNAKSEDAAKQPATKGPVRGSRRKSVISELHEKEKGLTAEKNMEAHEGRSMQIPVMPVKDTKAVGEGIQNAKGKDVEKPTRRSSRKSVLPDMIENNSGLVAAEMNAGMNVRRSTRKSVLPNMLEVENQDQSKMAKKNFQSGKCQDDERQQKVKEPIRRSRRSVAVIPLEEQNNGLYEEKIPKIPMRRSSRKSVALNEVEKVSKDDIEIVAQEPESVGEEGLKLRKHRRSSLEISSSANDPCKMEDFDGQKFRKQQNAQIPNEKDNTAGKQQASNSTTLVRSSSKRRRTSASAEVRSVKEANDDIILREATEDEHKATQEYKESCSRVQEYGQVNATREEHSSDPLLVTVALIEKISTEQSVPVVIPRSESGDNANESSDQSKQEHSDIQAVDSHLSETSGELDQSSCISVPHNFAVSEDKALMSNVVEESIRSADLGKCPSRHSIGNPLSASLHLEAAADDTSLPVLNADKGCSSNGSPPSFDLELMFAEECKESYSRKAANTPVEIDGGNKPSTPVTPGFFVRSDCLEGEDVQPTECDADKKLDDEGVAEEVLAQEDDQHVPAKTDLNMNLNGEPAGPGTESGCSITEKNTRHVADNLDEQAIILVQQGDVQAGTPLHEEIGGGNKPSTPVKPDFYVGSDCVEDDNVQPAGFDADKTLDVDQGVAEEEVLAQEKSNDQHVPTKTDLNMKLDNELAGPCTESGCSVSQKNARLFADNLDQQAIFQIQQGDLQEGVLKKPSPCSTTPECKHKCGVLPPKNMGYLSSAEQSPFGLESLFSQENIDKSMGSTTAHTKNGFNDSKDCHVKSALENTHVSEPYSHDDTEEGISKNDDSMQTSQQDNGIEGLPEANLDEERILSDSLDEKHVKEVINFEEVACEGEGNKKLVHSEELKASSEKTNVNGADGNAYGITDAVLSSAPHTPANENYEICLGSNTDVLHQGHNDQCSDDTGDIIEDTYAKYIEREIVLPSGKESSNLKDGQLNSKLEGAKVVESGLYFNKDIGNIIDSGSVVSEMTPSGSGLSKDSSKEYRQEVLDGFSMETSLDGSSTCEEKIVCRDAIENPSSLDGSSTCGEKIVCRDAIENPSISLATPGYKHEGALSEEAARTMKNYAGTCSSNPRELFMELQSLFSKGNTKESDPHESLAFPSAEYSGDESINAEQRVKLRHGSDLSHLDELIGSNCTEVLRQGHNHKDRSNVDRIEQVASEPCTNDIVEAADATKCIEGGLVLPLSEERSNLNDGQLNPKLESPNIMVSGLNFDKYVCNTSDDGSISVVVGERTPSGSALPQDYPKDHYPRQELLDGFSVESSLKGTTYGKTIVSGIAGIGNPSTSLGTPDYKYEGTLSEEAVCRMKDYAGTSLEDPRHLLVDLQSPFSEGSTEKSDLQDNLAFPSTESRRDEHIICHVEKLVDTHVSSEPDTYQGSCQDLSRHKEKESCMSVHMQVKESGGFWRSSHMKGSLTSVQIDLADDAHLIERDIVAAVEVHCEEKVERKSMPTSDSDILKEKSYSNGHDGQLNPELDGDEVEKQSLNCETALLPKDIYCEELELFTFPEKSSRSGICQSSSQKHIVEANSRLSSCGTELLHQDHKEECNKLNEGKFSSIALVENNITEDAPTEEMESSIMLPLVAGESEIPDESKELSFSCDKDTAENLCTGPAKKDLYPLPKDFHVDSCQKQEVPEVLSLPKSPEESAKFHCVSVSGSGPCQQRVNESAIMQVNYNIEMLNQDHKEYNQNNEDETTLGILASSVPEAVEIEQSEMEIGLIPATETSMLTVPDEQPNSKLEGNQDQITPGIPASSVPEAVEIEQSEMEIGLIPATETSVPDEQPNNKLEDNEVDEHSCSYDKDFSILFDSESLKIEAPNLHKDDCMDLSSECNHPNDLPAPRSPEQSAYLQNNNDSGSCQTSRRRGIAELRAKLQSFKVSSTIKGSYIAMSAPRLKPGDNMSQSAIALLRNIENTTAVKAGHPVKPNADGKDSSRRALQPISGRPREH